MRLTDERQAVEFGVGVGECRGVVRVARRVFQRLLPPPAGGASQTDPERSVVAAHAAVSLRRVGWRFQPSLTVCQCSPSKLKSQSNSIQFQNR